jgi:hypothetical protein
MRINTWSVMIAVAYVAIAAQDPSVGVAQERGAAAAAGGEVKTKKLVTTIDCTKEYGPDTSSVTQCRVLITVCLPKTPGR